MRLFLCAAALLISAVPAFAQGTAASPPTGSQGAAGNGGNGTTTSSSSGPEMKQGAQRSNTGGAPSGGPSGGSPGRN